MCHKTAVQNAQIERFVENGMPQKIVKTVKYTLKKRAAAIAVAEAVRARENADIQTPEQIPTRNPPITITTTVPSDVDGKPHEIETSAPTDVKKTSAPVTADLAVTVETKEVLQPIAEVEVIHLNVASTGEPPLIDATMASELSVQATTPKTVEQQLKVSVMQPNTEEKIPKMCGRFRKLQKQQKQVRVEGHMDALAKGTQMTKRFTQRVGKAIEVMQSSHFYTFLTKTTQPAHVIVVCILAFVLLTVWPQIMDSTQSNTPLKSASSVPAANTVIQQHNQHISQALGSEHRNHPLAVIAYLGAFATHFGAQIWMTFVSGLSLYFSLPRHTFGQCQQILFPKYFALNASLSISMIIVYVKYLLTTWTVASCIKMMAVAVCAVVEVTVRLYLAPPMLRLMHEKYKIEGTVGSGQEVGSIVQGDLAQCPHYQRVHKSFRRIHMAIAIGNMIVLCASCLHLYHLAAKIQIS